MPLEALPELTAPAAAGLSLLALAGGAALARLSGPLACTWPSKGAPMLARLRAVKLYRRPGRSRSVVGRVALAALLAGGGLGAYAAGPAQSGPAGRAGPTPAAQAVRPAVLSPASAPAPAASPGAAPSLAPLLAAVEAPPMQPQTVQPQTGQGQASPPAHTLLFFADDGDYAQVRADAVNKLPAAVRARLPANPIKPSASSVYAPAGADPGGVIALAFADPRGTWEPGELDVQGGRTYTRVSTELVGPFPVPKGMPHCVLTLFSVQPGPPAAAADPPKTRLTKAESDQAERLIIDKCTVCHDTTPIVAIRQGEAGWRALLAQMAFSASRSAYGPVLSQAETALALRYLVENYGLPTAS